MSFDPEQYSSPPRPRRRPPPGSNWAALLLAVIIGGALGVGILYLFGPRPAKFQAEAQNPAAPPREAVPAPAPDTEEQEAINVFKGARDSVVNVDTLIRVRNRLDMRVQEQQAGTGSGFVWDAEGRVVTNFHVVKQAVENDLSLRVVTGDRSAYTARVVGTAPDFDVAVLQVPLPKDKIKPIKVGTSADLQVGLKVFAIGNPFGLSLTMTQGIISALDREIESSGDRPITGAIQTDAPINPGNSGGPLLDKDGRLIGVNTAIYAPNGSGGNVGIGFAIPVDTVNEVVTQIIRSGKVQRPDLGIKLIDQWRLRRAGYETGVMIASVDPNGPAAAAGLHGLGRDANGDVVPGDVILTLNGQEVAGNQEFARMVSVLKVGTKAKLTIDRDGQKEDVEVTVRGI